MPEQPTFNQESWAEPADQGTSNVNALLAEWGEKAKAIAESADTAYVANHRSEIEQIFSEYEKIKEQDRRNEEFIDAMIAEVEKRLPAKEQIEMLELDLEELEEDRQQLDKKEEMIQAEIVRLQAWLGGGQSGEQAAA